MLCYASCYLNYIVFLRIRTILLPGKRIKYERTSICSPRDFGPEDQIQKYKKEISRNCPFSLQSLRIEQHYRQHTNMNTSLATSIQTFGSELFERLATQDSNICLSPFSISTCFALLIDGTDGTTKQQLMDTFHLPADYLAQFENTLATLGSNASISIANSLWASNKAPLDTDFVTTLLQHFKDAQIQNIDFTSEKAALSTINNWVNEKTHGHIPSALGRLTRNMVLVLVNAVYFCGKWLHPFKQTSTYDGNFRLLDNKNVRVPLMEQTSHMKYIREKSFEAISLPYKEDSSMFVILPDAYNRAALDQCCSKEFLTSFFSTHRNNMKKKEVKVTLPKFSFTNDFNLVKHLKYMGVTDAFSPSLANFSKLLASGSNQSVLDQAVHKTFIEVDEQGTRAAAVTAVTKLKRKRTTSLIHFEATRAFVYAIFHHPTEQLLFLGKVENPAKQYSEDSTSKKRGADAVENEEEHDESKIPSKKQKL